MQVASCVADLSGISSVVVGVIVDVLDSSIGQVDRVVALPVASAIGRFSTCILCAGVAVGHSILELIWDLLVKVAASNDATSNDVATSGIAKVRSKPGCRGKGQEGGDAEEHLHVGENCGQLIPM